MRRNFGSILNVNLSLKTLSPLCFPLRKNDRKSAMGGSSIFERKLFCLTQSNTLWWRRATFGIVIVLLCFGSVALAADDKPKPAVEKPKPEEPKVNPLEIRTPDPLLPKVPKKGSLTPEQQDNLRASLDELNTQAAATLKAGDPQGAFDLWYRELRLRRALGPVEEVQALGRVGEIAWQRSQTYDAQVISARLVAIQKEAEEKKSLTPELRLALGQAYQQMRLLEPAMKIYQQILAEQRERGDTGAQEETLKTLAQLSLDRFDYPQASAAYEELLSQAQTRGDRVNELVYLQQLIYIYDKAKQPQNALKTKQQLAETYLNQKDYTKLPALKIAIATDYEALNQPDEASQNYQEAYSMGLSLQQYAYASEALSRLATLYVSHDQPQFALQIYQVLLSVEQQSYDYYGLMNTYDKIGQIYLQHKQYPQALAVFQQGLELAKSLQYQENYFTTQIQRVNQQSSP
jgi:tetratricopeptide (TPR) repeat protein